MEITVFECHGPAQGDPPYVHCAGANMDSMKSYYRFVFDDADSGRSTVRLEARVEPKNWWSALLARVMVHLMRRSERDLLQRLKAYCEQG